MESNDRWTMVGLIVGIFFMTILLLWFLYSFNFGTDASAKIVGTAFTLVGGLVASMITLIGIMLRQSIAQRNQDLKEEAEKRLKLEAAIKAVGLLSTDSGGEVSMAQRTGAIYSLAHLGQIELATDLLKLAVVEGNIPPHAIASLIDLAFRANKPIVHQNAAEILRDHYKKLLLDNGKAEWPSSISSKEWPQDLSLLTRQSAIIGLMNLLLARPKNEWYEGSLNSFIMFLVAAFQSETIKWLKINTAYFLQEILKIYPKGTYFDFEDDESFENIILEVETLASDNSYLNSLFRPLIIKASHWRDK